MSKKPAPRNKSRKRKREKRSDGLYRKLDLSFPSSVAASSLTASAGLPNSDMIANASTNRLKLFYGPDIGDYVPPGRSTSAASSSLSELAAIHDSNPESYQEYLDSKKRVHSTGTNTYARIVDGDAIMGGRKTRRKKRRRKRKTKRKKRRRKRKTKKRRK